MPGYVENFAPSLWILFFARIVNAVAFTASFPFLASYFAVDRGVSPTVVGALYMGQGSAGALFQLVGGELAARVGHRPMLVFSLGMRALVSVGMGLAIHYEGSIPLLAGLVLCNGLLGGLFQPAADTLVTAYASGPKRISAFAHQRVAINIGWATGPIMGGLIAGSTAFEALFFAAAPFILLATAMVTRLPEGKLPKAPTRENPLQALGSQLANRSLRLQLVGALLLFILAGQMVVTLSVEAATRLSLPKQQLGFLWTLNGLVVVLFQMPVARWVTRLGTHRALRMSALLYAIGYGSVGFAGNVWHLVASMLVVSLGELLNAPSQQTAVAALAPPEHTSRMLGLLGLTMMLGRSTGPAIGGAAHDLFSGSPRLLWSAIASLGLMAAGIYFKTSPPAKQPSEQQAKDAEQEWAALGSTELNSDKIGST